MDFLDRLSRAADELLEKKDRAKQDKKERDQAIEDFRQHLGTDVKSKRERLNEQFGAITDNLPEAADRYYRGKGMVIVFEGIDGSGKDTQLDLMFRYLVAKGKTVKIYNSVADTPLSKLIRERYKDTELNNLTMLSLFLAEMGLLNESILKDKAEGEYDFILVNRWTYSTYAYARTDISASIENLVLQYIRPDTVIYLNTKPETAIARLEAKGEDVLAVDYVSKFKYLQTGYNTILDKVNPEGAKRIHIHKLTEQDTLSLNVKKEELSNLDKKGIHRLAVEQHLYLVNKLFGLDACPLLKDYK